MKKRATRTARTQQAPKQEGSPKPAAAHPQSLSADERQSFKKAIKDHETDERRIGAIQDLLWKAQKLATEYLRKQNFALELGTYDSPELPTLNALLLLHKANYLMSQASGYHDREKVDLRNRILGRKPAPWFTDTQNIQHEIADLKSHLQTMLGI